MPNISSLVKKTIKELKQANLVTKTDFVDKMKSLNQKINSNNAKHLLVKNELKTLQTSDSSYFIDKNHFEEVATQNYLISQPMYKCTNILKRVSGCGSGNCIYFWKFKGSCDRNITAPTSTGHKLNP